MVKQLSLGLQHLLAMYAGAVAVPLLIGTGLGFNEAANDVSDFN
jgi:xanthine permease